MPPSSCLTCGARTKGSYCPRHAPTGGHRSANRDRATQARFRKAVLERDGHRCRTTEHGVRCPATTDLRACHITPLARGGSNSLSNGLTRCARHDRMTDPKAR